MNSGELPKAFIYIFPSIESAAKKKNNVKCISLLKEFKKNEKTKIQILNVV